MTVQLADPILSTTFAQEILESRTFEQVWNPLLATIKSVPPPLREAEPFTDRGRPMTPKRQRRTLGGAEGFCLFPVHQKQWNKDLDTALRREGWATQPFVVTGEGLTRLPTLLKGDFHRRGVFVEVEFGNAASFHRDLFKFHIAGRSGSGSVGVAIVMVDKLARFADQGLTTFEQARSLLPYIQISLSMPVAVIGLTLDSFHPIADRYNEMQAVAEAHDVKCHSFERVFGEALLVEESDGEPD